MNVLITGAGGFVARYLVCELTAHGHQVYTTDVLPSVDLPNYRRADLCNSDEISQLVHEVRPDACAHLGAVSFVPDGGRDPGKLLSVNIGGTVNILSALRTEARHARFLFVSTAQVYGCALERTDAVVSEESPAYPLSLYTISKCAGEQAALAYWAYHGMDVMIARPGNHTGPGQSVRFLVASLVAQAMRIKAGEQDCFVAGNLESERDFTDVRDVVCAYRLILERGRPGAKYNISSGNHVPLRRLLEMVQTSVGIDAPVRIDQGLVRDTDYSRIMDTANIRALGWSPVHSLEQTILDMHNNLQSIC